MSFFQNSVLQKHLRNLDHTAISYAYQAYRSYFHDAAIQKNIREAKEEQFQEGFLRELFVNILGYTLNPKADYNLTTELKNEKGSKKADGAILKNGKAIGVIELKGTDTKDLEKVNVQAFNYKNNHSDCIYVVTSNFEKLRFFIHNAVEHLEFNLFELNESEFQVLWLCLHCDNLMSGLPLKVKEESLVAEENITKQLYKDYSAFKEELWQNLCKNHPKDDQLMLFKKTQKLLDRFLFIFFAEDSGLLPPNSISKIINKWKNDTDWGEHRTLYDIFKQYFGFINSGRPARGERAAIFGYNGGLFQDDVIIDNLKIDDDVLQKHTEKLTAYDFETEIDVNILGHIFENSLTEIEHITAKLEGQEVEKSKSKRKKDGVFYTPKYITKYIVDQTVGRLCEEKKAELNISDERFGEAGKRSKKGITDLQAYRDWLLELKICDPACGSGAFLNQALEFLIEEHRYLDELTAQYHKAPLVLSDIETQILEQNLFGVDINEESVEIAKLSLWLRTAQKGRKLTSLNHNIKCGNSLIDDPAVAGEKAFNWQKEFPQVFAKGGFDAVIGNPPYVKLETIRQTSIELEQSNFITFDKRGDLYVLFVEQGFKILRKGGVISYIMPNKWLQAGYGKKLREYLLRKNLNRLIDFGDLQIFEGATTYPVIFVARQNKPSNTFYASLLKESGELDFEGNVKLTQEVFKTNTFSRDTWVISSGKHQKLLEKLNRKFSTLQKVVNGEANYGIKPGLTEAFIIDEGTKKSILNDDVGANDLIKPMIRGRDIKPWVADYQNFYFICTFPALNIDIEKYPSIKEHLLSFGKNRLEQSGEKGSRKKTNNKWFETQDTIAYYQDFLKPKIMYQTFQVKPCFIFDESGLFCNNSMWIIPTDNKALLGVLNSKMGWWLITKYCTQIQNGYQLIWKYFGQIPVPDVSDSKSLFGKVEEMIASKTEEQKILKAFLKHLQSKFNLEKLSKKLQHWPQLEFKDFLNELKKAKVKLSLSEEAEWMAYFNEQKEKVRQLQSEIDSIDREIDRMVYELYELTEEEIRIVEGS
jgi:type I restriction-modification system DNA methylase subunit